MLILELSANERNALTEVHQSTYSKFAIIRQSGSHVYENSMPFVKCRDYFNDIMYVQYSEAQELGSIYGFKWEWSTHLDDDIRKHKLVRMAFTCDSNYLDSKGRLDLSRLNTLEKEMRIRQTKAVLPDQVVFLDDQQDVGAHRYIFVLEISPTWFSNAFMLSAFTQLVRMLHYKGDTFPEMAIAAANQSSTDESFRSVLTSDDFYALIRHSSKIIGKFVAQDIDESTISDCDDELVEYVHNGSGMYSMIQGIKGHGLEPALSTWVTKFNIFKAKHTAKEKDHYGLAA